MRLENVLYVGHNSLSERHVGPNSVDGIREIPRSVRRERAARRPLHAIVRAPGFPGHGFQQRADLDLRAAQAVTQIRCPGQCPYVSQLARQCAQLRFALRQRPRPISDAKRQETREQGIAYLLANTGILLIAGIGMRFQSPRHGPRNAPTRPRTTAEEGIVQSVRPRAERASDGPHPQCERAQPA